MSEEYSHGYDVIVKMKIRTKEDLPEKDVINSVEIALWGERLTILEDAWVCDLDFEGKKEEAESDVA